MSRFEFPFSLGHFQSRQQCSVRNRLCRDALLQNTLSLQTGKFSKAMDDPEQNVAFET